MYKEDIRSIKMSDKPELVTYIPGNLYCNVICHRISMSRLILELNSDFSSKGY